MSEVIEFEVSAKRAIFGRVDSTGALTETYEIPTPTAVEGICTSIVGIHRARQTAMRAVYVKLCSEVKTDIEKTNSHCLGRKYQDIKEGTIQQSNKIFLVDQRWIFGVQSVCATRDHESEAILRDMFKRYIKKGQQIKAPCLGHAEMFPDYIGPVRQDTKVNTGYTKYIHGFLIRTFDGLIDGKFSPVYANVCVRGGFLDYSVVRKDNNVL